MELLLEAKPNLSKYSKNDGYDLEKIAIYPICQNRFGEVGNYIDI